MPTTAPSAATGQSLVTVTVTARGTSTNSSAGPGVSVTDRSRSSINGTHASPVPSVLQSA